MPRKIIYYVDSPIFGGSEQALLHLLTGIDRQRWQPVLFHPPEDGLKPFVTAVQQMGIGTKIVPRMLGAESAVQLPVFCYHLWKEHPAIFHAQLSWLLSCKYGLLAARITRVPLIVATLQLVMPGPWIRLVDVEQRFVRQLVDQYLAVSGAVAQQLHYSFRVPEHKIRVIQNGIPVSKFDCPPNEGLRRKLSSESSRPIILTVARLDAQKGHTVLLRAMKQVPEAILLLAGDGPERPVLEDKARQMGIQEQVIFLGYREDVPELLASCDLFVLPSLYEGFPLSVLEAMAAGKPVVATAVAGISEAVVNGETGLLIPPEDPGALASAIRQVLFDPALSHRMGQAGKARVRSRFSVESMVARTAQTYEELLSQRL